MHESEKRKCQSLNCVQLFATPWAEARQAPLFMSQAYRSAPERTEDVWQKVVA